MSFRRRPPLGKRDDAWSIALSENAVLARRTGLPREVLEDRVRFSSFLEHGYDELRILRERRGDGIEVAPPIEPSDQELEAIADLAQRMLGDDAHRVRITSRWQRG